MVATPRILLADCDHMFVSVARLCDPEGAGKARFLVVGGSKSRGVVVSASYEARAFGVRAGMPSARAARLCPELTFASVPRGAIGAKHREMRTVLEQWSPVVEGASVDEFYLDLTGTEQVYHREPLEETACKIRADAMRRTGLPVSIGGGTNRLIAKLAAERAKPKPGTDGTGVLIVPPGQEAAFLETHALAEIPGVGPRLQATLKRYGLVQVRDALRIDEASLERWLGGGTGRWLCRRIRGQGSEQVHSNPENKSISHETTFSKDLVSDDAIETRLLALITSLAAALRADGLTTRCITVKLRDHDFRTRQASRTVPEPLSTDRALFNVARELLAGLRRRRRTAARLVGVSFATLDSRAGPPQLELLEWHSAGETGRDQRLAAALDNIKEKLGQDSIRPARLTRPSAESR
ncbi:MAG TPA: DNA polymerase IV [Gemmatimonadales bacterium]|jgi:DNA polymerase-4|nr:DNA polymerase IV [Gemmatimonadales bacterium]